MRTTVPGLGHYLFITGTVAKKRFTTTMTNNPRIELPCFQDRSPGFNLGLRKGKTLCYLDVEIDFTGVHQAKKRAWSNSERRIISMHNVPNREMYTEETSQDQRSYSYSTGSTSLH